jgi:NADH dehydrogenase
MKDMILVTGGTGFIGQALIRQLITNGYEVRTLVRPGKASPRLPRGIPLDVVVSSLADERGVLAAMKDVDQIYHLVTGEYQGSGVNLLSSDIQSTQVVVKAALESGIKHLIYVSHLGSDRASAYPVLKSKGIAENIIKTSGVPYTILRSGIVYGPGDHLTEGLRSILQASRFFFMLPDGGETHLQPIWIEDLVSAMIWTLEDPDKMNKTIEVGGPEAITLKEMVESIQSTIGVKNSPIRVSSAYMRIITVTMESLSPAFPLSNFWLDYFSTDRICSIDTMPRQFSILPAKFSQKISYLKTSRLVRTPSSKRKK